MSFMVKFIVGFAINEILAICLGFFLHSLIEKNKNKKANEEQIISMVLESHEQGMIEESEAAMINNIFEFGDKVAKDIMTDRSNIVGIEVHSKLEDAIEIMLDGSNSRFPVYDDNIDHIVGILHLKDAVRFSRDKNYKKKTLDSVEDLLKEPKFIPETRKVDALFKTMRDTKLQMVVVIDEYGQTAGIVAMRDILEEIVGDIDDEYDDDGFIVAKRDNKLIVEGMTPLEDIEENLNISFDGSLYETINGFMVSQMEHIPDKKEKFECDYGGYRFKVLSVENKMVKQVLITKIIENEVMECDEQDKEGED